MSDRPPRADRPGREGAPLARRRRSILAASGRFTRRRWLKAGVGGVVASSGCLSRAEGSRPNEDEPPPETDDESDAPETDDLEGGPPRDRSISAENERGGDDGWRPQSVPSSRYNEAIHLVEGYADVTSVDPRGRVGFHVSTDSDWRYRIDVYRLGWYGGAGGRHVATLPSGGEDSPGRRQPDPESDPETGRITCDWDVTDVLDVPEDWVSGLYVARFVLTTGEHEGTSTVHPFVVRPHRDREAAALVQLPMATEQAYNGWGGKSLYDHTSDGEAANAISFDRPLANELTFHLNYAVHFLRFAERGGDDVAYVCDVDVHRNPEILEEYDAVISAGHDEYWSRTQRLAFERARDAGTDVGFFGSNIAYWQVRYEDDERTMVCYKETVDDDPVQDERRSGLFRDVGLPECELQGVMGWGAGLHNFPDFEVQAEAMDHPWMTETGFEAGDRIEAVVGPEWDWIRDDCVPPGSHTNFFHYEEGTSELEIHKPADADAVAYETPSGATVFSAGTLGYTVRIDPDPDWDVGWPTAQLKAHAPSVAEPDPRLQRFTRNALDDLLGEE